MLQIAEQSGSPQSVAVRTDQHRCIRCGRDLGRDEGASRIGAHGRQSDGAGERVEGHAEQEADSDDDVGFLVLDLEDRLHVEERV